VLRVVVAQQLQRVHVIGIAADQSLQELDFDFEVAPAGAARFFSGTAFDWHTTQAVFPSHYLKSSCAIEKRDRNQLPFQNGCLSTLAATTFPSAPDHFMSVT
jgi:hypothetical protein